MAESPVIIGAGPAGIRAAQTLVRHGLRPIVLDEAARWGGQIYRQQPENFQRSSKQLYGFDARNADTLSEIFTSLLGKIDYRPETTVWNAEKGRLDLLTNGASSSLPWTSLIVATGATDRILPFPGWTLPGIYTMGASQIALKYQACAIGSNIVLAGTGPLLYLVAYQYVKAGANVQAVLDTSPLTAQIRALPGLLNQPRQLARGLYYVGWLLARGIKLRRGIRIVRAKGKTHAIPEQEDRIAELVIQGCRGRLETLACDALGFGYALRSETQIADILSCDFRFDPLQRGYLPLKDGAGRSSVDGVYLAGDGAGIMGAEAAELSGERSALALLVDRGVCRSDDRLIQQRIETLDKHLAKISHFRAGLEQAFPCPDDWIKQLDDETIVCRCEEITFGQIRETIAECGIEEVNRLKAMSRAGMGRCQGRMCAQASAEILAHFSGQTFSEVGRLRGQPPIKPVPVHAVARSHHATPEGER